MGIFRSGRSGPTRNQLAARGLVLIAGFGVLLLLMTLSLKGTFADTSKVSTRLDTAGGALIPGGDVKLAGLAVGKVSSITSTATGVSLELVMDNGLLDGIPRDVKARVLPATVFGTSYVDLVAPSGSASRGTADTRGSSLRAGDVIEQDRSVPTLELQKALDSIDRLVDALGPAELNTALSSLAGALDGQGDTIGRLIEVADRYLGRVTPKVPLIRQDLALLATNLETIGRIAPDLFDAVDDALFVGGHLVEHQAEFTSLLTGGLNLVRDSDRLLSDNDTRLVAVVRNAAVITNAFYVNRTGLRTGLLAVGQVTRRIQTTGSGGRIEVKGRLIEPKYRSYTRADCPRYNGARGGNC